jgi:hypothetical protein
MSVEFPQACRSLQPSPQATMIRLKPAHRRILVAHVPELANLAAGSLLFGQYLTDRPYSLVVAMLGIVLWFVLIGVTFLAANDG